MKSLSVTLIRLEVGVRWTARALTVFLVDLFLVPLVVNSIYDVIHGYYESRLPHAFWMKGVDPIQMICFWTACMGLVAAWRWPVTGGALSLGGMLLLFVIEFAVRGGSPGGLTLYLIPLRASCSSQTASSGGGWPQGENRSSVLEKVGPRVSVAPNGKRWNKSTSSDQCKVGTRFGGQE